MRGRALQAQGDVGRQANGVGDAYLLSFVQVSLRAGAAHLTLAVVERHIERVTGLTVARP